MGDEGVEEGDDVEVDVAVIGRSVDKGGDGNGQLVPLLGVEEVKEVIVFVTKIGVGGDLRLEEG